MEEMLGLFHARKRFGTGKQRRKRWLVLEVGHYASSRGEGVSLLMFALTVGPPSELGLLIQADAAAKDLQTKQKKERAAEALAPWGDRPLFTSTQSFESKDTDARSVEDVESEAGDEESVVGSVARRKPAKARPRKSKLAQEITVGSVE